MKAKSFSAEEEEVAVVMLPVGLGESLTSRYHHHHQIQECLITLKISTAIPNPSRKCVSRFDVTLELFVSWGKMAFQDALVSLTAHLLLGIPFALRI